MRVSSIRNFRRGFTLIELLIVITIIAVLVSIAVPVFNGVQERARVVQDMNNLRQIGLGTQLYLNDNDGVLFDANTRWMDQLHPKYLGAWKIFQSPFDQRSPSETNATAPISYGLNGNNKVGSSIAGLLVDKVKSASTFIIFAPAQDGGAVVRFSGLPGASVTVYKAGAATGGTHGSRRRINVVFADWHSETMPWATFINDTNTATDPSASLRWDPYTPYP